MDGNSFSTSPWRKSRGTPIDISDTESDDLSNEDVAAKEKNKKQRAKIRAMNRMYPAVMRKKMMQEADAAAKAKKRHRPVQVSSESNQDEPLLPGRTRPRKGEHPRDIKDIKGDTESSNEAVSDSMDISRDNRPASSDSDVEVVVRPKQRHHVDNNREVWKSDEDISDGRIDDERIEAYLQEGPFRPSRFRERSMIDWMLDNTAEVGGTRRRRGSSRPRKLKGVVSGAPKQGAKRQGFDKRLDRGQSPELYRDRSPNLDPDIRAAPLLRTNPTHGPTHQTRLTFEKSSGRKRSFAHQQGDPSSYSERRHWVGGDDGAPISDEEVPEPLPNIQHIQDIPDPVALRKAARKQKEKERRAHMNMNGIWVFNNKGIRIAKAITIDVADRGFHQALAPRNAPPPARVTHNNEKAPVVSKARSKPKPHTNAAIHQRPRVNRVKSNGRLLPRGERRAAVDRPDPEIDEESENPEESENLEAAETEHRGQLTGRLRNLQGTNIPHTDLTTTSSSRPSRTCQFLVDFGLSKLPSGTGFDASTYIRKGALVELLELLSADPQKPPPPGCYSAHEFDLGPEVDLHRMLAHMDQICDRFFEFATGLPEDSEETAEQATGWEGLMHVICQLVSWYLAAGDDIEVLKDAVQTQIIRLTSQIRAASLTAKSMDATTFSLCWFAVELSARLGFRFPIWSNNRLPESNLLFESTTLLIEHLLEYGLEPVLDLLKVEGALEGATPSHRALEVWVCLLHLCGSCQALDAKSASPLWKMIQNTLAARQSNAASHLDASEDAWQVLIGLQTISRFNQHGMTVQTSILPASWPFVVFCLERIRFKANEDVDHTLSESGLDNLDIYIKLVVQRCCHLWSKWGWACDDAFDALCRLVDIFKSRQFADLRHEGKPDFPDFLRTNEWDFLDRQIHSETAFVLFLKLVYQTLQVNKSKVNKLLSLAMPIATLPFSKERPPRLQDLSMLYNRLSALAIAIHVDPTQQVRWIQLARGYIKFQDADATTRNAHIRGLMYLSIVMVQGGLALDEPIRWLEEMVNVLLDQHKHKPDDRSVIISLHLLVGCVDKVLQAYVRQYPDPRLILSLERIFRSPTLIKANTESAHAVPRVMRSFLQARAVAIPPPKRPSLPVPATEQESQEDYGDEMWNDAMLADLDKEESITDAQIKAKDASIRKLLEENIAWTLFRQTAQYTNYSGMQKSLRCDDDWSVDFASLVECWLGCGSIVIQNGHKSWQQYLSSYFDSSPKQLDDFSTRKIKLLMYSNVLKLDPMTYLDPTMQEAFMGVLFESLATWYTTVEDEFIQLLLSIDGLQHPLLTDASWKRDETIASKIELLDLRIPLLKVIISNLSDCLHDGLKPEENSRYVTWLIAMYTAMKEIHSELKDESQGAYARWCVEVGRALRSHPIFLGEGRLAQWIAWAGRLEEE
ncbi:Mus7/MMS22 family-domain-containing protein [Mycena rebaudengoi]|nr:Mus7/MMS22 family-domain-containing protein [Mycena rebaudengoi]